MWLIIFVVTVLIELLTTALITIWFAIGSLIALILSWCGASLSVQIIGFILGSILSLIFTKPYVQKRLLPKDKIQKTNIDALIEKHATVTIEIENGADKGEVLLDGKFWTARTKDNAVIPINSTVKVLSIEGVKVFVEQVVEDKKE